MCKAEVWKEVCLLALPHKDSRNNTFSMVMENPLLFKDRRGTICDSTGWPVHNEALAAMALLGIIGD